MDVGRAFQYIADDDKWLKKLLVGLVVSVVPILNFAAFGYAVQVTQNVAAGEVRPLPDWDRFGRYLKNGLRVAVAFFLYLLPLFFIMGCFIIFMAVTASATDSGEPPAAFMVIFPLLMLCLMPYSLLLNLMFPTIFIQVARRESLAACLNWREMWHIITAKLDSYILIIALYFGLNILASFIMFPLYFIFFFLPITAGTAVPEWIIGLIFFLVMGIMIIASLMARFLVFLVVGHLEGQYIRQIDGETDQVPADAAE